MIVKFMIVNVWQAGVTVASVAARERAAEALLVACQYSGAQDSETLTLLLRVR